MSDSSRVRACAGLDGGPWHRAIPPLTHSMFVRYAGALGEFNPVHEDVEVAQAAGYPDIFAQGMFLGAIAASHVRDRVGSERLAKIRMRFVAPAFRGDRLTAESRVTSAAAGDDGRSTVETRISTHDGRTVLIAWSEIRRTAPIADREEE